MNPVLNYVLQAQNVKDHKVPILKMENEHLGGKAGEQLSWKVHMGPADARLCQRLQRESARPPELCLALSELQMDIEPERGK